MSTEIITDSDYLRAALNAAAEQINTTLDLIISHEEAFEDATLEPRLRIGRELAKAQAEFGITKAEGAAIGGHAKAALSRRDKAETEALDGSVSRRDTLAPAPNFLGFSAWIEREIPRLKRTTAIKYASSFKALDLPLDASDAKITAKIKDLRHVAGKASEPMPTLTSLYKSNRPAKQPMLNLPPPGTENGKSQKQVRLELAREILTVWREEGEKHINDGHLDWLDKKGLEELKEFQGWLRDRINARLQTF